MKAHAPRIFQGITIVLCVALTFALAFLVGDEGHKLIETFVMEFIKTALG